MAAVAITLLGAAGVLCLACAMARHQRDLLGRALSARAGLAARIAGWVLIVAAAVLGIAARGWAVGVTIWLAALSLGAIMGVLVVTWAAAARNRECRPLHPSPRPATARQEAGSDEP